MAAQGRGPVLGRLTQEEDEFEASLSYIVIAPGLKTNKPNKQTPNKTQQSCGGPSGSDSGGYPAIFFCVCFHGPRGESRSSGMPGMPCVF